MEGRGGTITPVPVLMLVLSTEPACVLVVGLAVVVVVRGEGEGRTPPPLLTFIPSSMPTTPLTLFHGEALVPVIVPILFTARPLGLALPPPIVPDCVAPVVVSRSGLLNEPPPTCMGRLLRVGARGEAGERACIAMAACAGMRRLLLGDVITLRITRWIPPTARDRAAVVVAMDRTVWVPTFGSGWGGGCWGGGGEETEGREVWIVLPWVRALPPRVPVCDRVLLCEARKLGLGLGRSIGPWLHTSCRRQRRQKTAARNVRVSTRQDGDARKRFASSCELIPDWWTSRFESTETLSSPLRLC